jgi:hypothetical protein
MSTIGVPKLDPRTTNEPRALMRKFLLLGVVTTAALLPSLRSSAYYEGPWCAILNDGGGSVSENCSMSSFEMCREEALRNGTSSFCRQNGRYPGYWSAGSRPRPTHRKKTSHN